MIYHNGKTINVFAHQIIYYIEYGITVDCIDHIDNNPSNNIITNLRSVTHQQNHFNQSNTKGYSYDKSRGKYKSEIMLNNKSIYLGRFETEEEARQAYLEAKEKYHII